MVKNATQNRPRFSQTNEPLKIVVEGVGDVVENYYGPAFEVLKKKLQGKREIQVTFVDDRQYWKRDANLSQKMQGIIASVEHWGAEYLDKSKPEDFRTYSKFLQADVVIIATPDFTHGNIATEWLKRNPPPEQIFIEKPLDSSLDAARTLLGKIKPYDNRVLAFDHYRARLLPTRDQMNVILGFLGEGLTRFTFYFLEDHSGGDPKFHPLFQRDGPLENEQRVKALQQGVILDGMPHMIALLAHFCRGETLRVTKVQAGQYIGVDGNSKKRTEVEKETFAGVEFVCADYQGHLVAGNAYVGKGVRGVEELGPEYDYNVKLLVIEGLNGNKVCFDLRSSGPGASEAQLIDKNGKTQFWFKLNPKPYETFLEKVADGIYLDDRVALHVETGKRILEILEDMRHPIPDKNEIPEYPCGMKNVRPSLYLEKILDALPMLYGY
ncbi:MAG: Gfo/Idh/MocA family oxidoreductase [bacterium]